jgi:hypothetical protein
MWLLQLCACCQKFIINQSVTPTLFTNNPTNKLPLESEENTRWIFYRQCARKVHEVDATSSPGKMFKTTRIAKTTSVTHSWHPSDAGKKAKI